MKIIALAGALAISLLAGTSSGRPFERAIVTEVVYVTETLADAIIYVDEEGLPYSTTTIDKIASTTTSVIVTSTSSSALLTNTKPSPMPQAPSASTMSTSSTLPIFVYVSEEPGTVDVTTLNTSSPHYEESPITTSAAVESANVPLPPSPSPLATSEVPAHSAVKQYEPTASHLPMGITYDPFAGSEGNCRCKTEQEIAIEFSKTKDYKVVRIYGMGCNIIPLAVQNAIQNGQKLMAGAYISNRGNGEKLEQVIQVLKNAIDQYAGGSWDIIQLFAVENERVNDHDMTASDVVAAIHDARVRLRGLGYNGPVGAVETVPATIDNPAICEASDVVMVNCHPFFDANTDAQNAGEFVKSQLDLVKSTCKTNRVIITESGWPHKGDANGAAIPSPENQRIALDSIRSHFEYDVFLHNAFDSTWKSDWASSFNAERWWGVIE